MILGKKIAERGALALHSRPLFLSKEPGQMSLYNAIFGENKSADQLLAMLGLTKASVGRYRDCYLDDKGQIVVYTRNGGGNRDDYAEETAELQAHPLYLDDYDDDFDCTYAYYRFRVPEEQRKKAEAILTEQGPRDPCQEFDTLVDNLKTRKVTPETTRALQVRQSIFSGLDRALKDGGKSAVVQVNKDGTIAVGQIDEKGNEEP